VPFSGAFRALGEMFSSLPKNGCSPTKDQGTHALITRNEKMRCDYAPNASLLPKAHVLIGWYQNHPPSFKHRAKRILPSQKQFSKGETRRDENRKSRGKLTTMADYGKHGRIWAEKDEEKRKIQNINVTCNTILSVYRTYLRRGDRRD
jgi:hypothetical protein